MFIATNGKGVIEALLGIESTFVRTPKYKVERNQEGWERKIYVRRRIGWIPVVELLMAAYFFYAAAYSFSVQNYLTTPFLMLFLVGYSYMGTMSLLQTPFRRLWFNIQEFIRVRTGEISPAPSQS